MTKRKNPGRARWVRVKKKRKKKFHANRKRKCTWHENCPQKKEKKTKIKVDRTKISVILCYMENKTTALENFRKLCASNAPSKERIAAWENYVAIAHEAPRARNTCSTRSNGRKFFGRYDANGNYHDVS